jgi:putative ABC transport system ATP-binding protein
MVTHDLRMCEYVDRVLLMRDGKLTKIYKTKKEIRQLARSGRE